jgi:hypothetical protein
MFIKYQNVIKSACYKYFISSQTDYNKEINLYSSDRFKSYINTIRLLTDSK